MAFDTAENQEEKLGLWSIIFLSPEDELRILCELFWHCTAPVSVRESSGHTYSDYSDRYLVRK